MNSREDLIDKLNLRPGGRATLDLLLAIVRAEERNACADELKAIEQRYYQPDDIDPSSMDSRRAARAALERGEYSIRAKLPASASYSNALREACEAGPSDSIDVLVNREMPCRAACVTYAAKVAVMARDNQWKQHIKETFAKVL